MIRALKARLRLRARMPRPHFLGIGTQKGGTTSLHHLLSKHKEVFLPVNKEIHYFTTNYNKGVRWYCDQFQQSRPGQLRGEITPYYMFHEEAPKRIYAFRSSIRLIVLLRNPIERALSQYFHSRRLGLETLELKAALDAETSRMYCAAIDMANTGGNNRSHQEHSYLARSRYDEQLKRYFQYFQRKQILIIKSEDFYQGDPKVVKEITDFLEISPFNSGISIPCANRGSVDSADVDPEVRIKLSRQLQPTLDWLSQAMNIHW